MIPKLFSEECLSQFESPAERQTQLQSVIWRRCKRLSPLLGQDQHRNIVTVLRNKYNTARTVQ